MLSEKADIRIFVSRRIDVDSVLVPNPLYIPVRCGAVFDTENPKDIGGDDTGDNISVKRESFCEFTVQYWAWKNIQADYYGLCHYRRYLAFDGSRCRMDEHGLTPWPELNNDAMKHFGLLDEQAMRSAILSHDLVIPRTAPVDRMPLPRGRANNVRQLWEAHNNIFFDKTIITRLLELIGTLAPQYSVSAHTYFSGNKYRGCNCYVMRRELFYQLCRFQFPIMEALEREGVGNRNFPRAVGYAGEMLFGIFCNHVIVQEGACALELPLVMFAETTPARNIAEQLRRRFVFLQDQISRRLAAPLFPLGSRRRECFKRFYYQITRRKKIGASKRNEEAE